MRCSGRVAASGRLIPNGLGVTIGGEVVDSWKPKGRFITPNPMGRHTSNTMFHQSLVPVKQKPSLHLRNFKYVSN